MGRKSSQTLRREFLEHQRRERGRAPHTLYEYDRALGKLIEHLGTLHVCEATTAHLRCLVLAPTLRGKRGAGVEPAPATKKRRVMELRTFYRWLHEEGYIATNPAARLHAPEVHNENPKPFPSDLWKELWASNLDDSDRVGFGLAMFCGLRRHEVTGLTARHFVDVPRPIIANFKRKGGARRNLPYISCVRFFAERRPELIGGDPRTFLDPLERLRAARAGKPALLDWQDTLDRRWPIRQKHERPEGHIDPQTFGRHLERALVAIGKPRRAGSPHMMRHAFCTNLLDAGVPLLDVSRLAGHSSVVVTQRYLATSEDPLAKLLAEVDGDVSVSVNPWM